MSDTNAHGHLGVDAVIAGADLCAYVISEPLQSMGRNAADTDQKLLSAKSYDQRPMLPRPPAKEQDVERIEQ